MRLRYYQEGALEACTEAYARGVHRMLVSLPTGTGKTVVLASLPHYVLPKKGDCTVVLVNRDELVGQTLQKIQAVSPGAHTATEKGAMRAKGDEEYIVASVYTLHERRIDDFFDRMKGRVGLLIADEAHHAAAFQYRRIFDKFFKERPEGIVVGVTATPQRGDGIGLGSAFDETVYHKDMRWAIQDGWLVPIKCFNVATNTNLDDVETRMGDFAPEQLAKAVDVDERNNIAVSAYLEHAKGRKGIVFAPTLSHAKHINETFIGRGVKSEWANGTFRPADRERIVHGFRNGTTDMLVNVALWIEGFDVPDVEVMIGIRPTQSRAMFCLDMQTEILSKNGWLAYEDVDKKTELAVYLDDGSIEWQHPIAKIKRPLGPDERMVSCKAQSLDIRVSDKHQMLIEHRQFIDGKVTYTGKYTKKTAAEITKIRMPGRLPANGIEHVKESILTDYEIRFVGLWITDGSTHAKTGAIFISQSSTSPGNSYIRAALEESGIKYRISTVKSNGNHFKESAPRLIYHIYRGRGADRARDPLGISRLDKYLHKDLSPNLEELNERQFAILLEAMHVGDGSKQLGQYWTRRSYHIASGNKTMCDHLQSLAIRRGWRCNITTAVNTNGNPIYFARLKKQTFHSTHNADGRPGFKVEPPSCEDIWCVETPAGTIVARRNGKAIIMGNCQMVGRVLRPDEKTARAISQDGLTAEQRRAIIANSVKPSALLLDLVDQTRRLGLVTLPTLWGLPPKMEMKGEDVEKLKEAVEELEKIDPVAAGEVTSLEHIKTSIAEVSAFAPPVVDEKISAISSLAWRSGGDADDFTLDLPERRIAYDKDGRVIKDFSRIYRECQVSAKNANLKFEDHLQERAPHDPELVRVAQDSVRIRKIDDTYQAEYSWDGETRVLGHEKNVARAFGRTERWIENNRNDILSALSARAPWRAQRATQKQLERLRGMGVPIHLVPDTRGEADMLIKKLIDEKRKDSEETTRDEAVG